MTQLREGEGVPHSDQDAGMGAELQKDLAHLSQVAFETKDLQRVHYLQRKIVREYCTQTKTLYKHKLVEAIKDELWELIHQLPLDPKTTDFLSKRYDQINNELELK